MEVYLCRRWGCRTEGPSSRLHRPRSGWCSISKSPDLKPPLWEFEMDRLSVAQLVNHGARGLCECLKWRFLLCKYFLCIPRHHWWMHFDFYSRFWYHYLFSEWSVESISSFPVRHKDIIIYIRETWYPTRSLPPQVNNPNIDRCYMCDDLYYTYVYCLYTICMNGSLFQTPKAWVQILTTYAHQKSLSDRYSVYSDRLTCYFGSRNAL